MTAPRPTGLTMSRQLAVVLLLVASAQLTSAFAPGAALPLVQSRGRAMALRPAMMLPGVAAPPAAGLIAKASAAAPLAAAQASILVRTRQPSCTLESGHVDRHRVPVSAVCFGVGPEIE